jgi:hypothetical protein
VVKEQAYNLLRASTPAMIFQVSTGSRSTSGLNRYAGVYSVLRNARRDLLHKVQHLLYRRPGMLLHPLAAALAAMTMKNVDVSTNDNTVR